MVDWRSGTGVVIWWMEPGVVIWWMEPGVHISEVGEWKLRTAGFWLAELWPELWLAELWPELWLAELWPELWLAELWPELWPELWLAELWPELWLAELWPELWLAELWPELWLAELWPELWLAELWPVVWGRLKLQHQSYSNFVCHGESMNFDATPLIWRLTKSHSNRMPSLSMSWDPFDTVWHGCGQWVRRNTSKCKTCKKQDILSHDFCVDVIRPGVLWYVCSLESIGSIMSEIHNLVFSWRFIKLWRHATVTRCDEKLIFELVCMSILLWWQSSWLEVDVMKALGQVR